MTRRSRARDLALPLALATLLFALRLHPEGEADLGWHLAQGRLLAAGHWITSNALSWTAPGQPWTDNSWLFDLLAYGSARLFGAPLGPQLLTGIFFALALAGLGLALLEASPRGAWLLPALALALLSKATPRAHVASWAALAWTLGLALRADALDRAGEDAAPGRDDLHPNHSPESKISASRGDRLRLAALLPIWLDAQLHAGAAFSAGLLGLFALAAATRQRSAAGALRALAPALLAAAALLAGPAGPAQLAYLVRNWSVREIVLINEAMPWRLAAEPLLPGLAAPALSGLLLSLRADRRRPQARLALLAATLIFLGLALRHVRFFYELTVVAAPGLALGLELLRAQASRGRWRAPLALSLFTLLIAAGRGLGAPIRLEPRSVWSGELPVRASRFLDAHELGERGFNGLRDGGLLAWLRPAHPVFVDGRIYAYPASLWRALEAAEASPAAFDAFLRARGAEWALTEREDERLSGYHLLEGNPGWALIYWDDTDALYLRRDVARFTPLVDALELHELLPEKNLLAALPAMDAKRLALLDGESARLLELDPGAPWPLAASCLARLHLRVPDASARCQAALAAAKSAGDEKTAALLEELRGDR